LIGIRYDECETKKQADDDDALMVLLFVLLASRKLSLSFLSTPNFEPRSDKDLGESSLRESLPGDLLGM
jgi:hypothetical protein